MACSQAGPCWKESLPWSTAEIVGGLERFSVGQMDSPSKAVPMTVRRMSVTDMKRSRPWRDPVVRVITISEELEGPLFEALAELDAGEEFVLRWLRPMSGASLRRPLLKAIQEATGVEPWSNLWRTVRPTRERELHDQRPADAWKGDRGTAATKRD